MRGTLNDMQQYLVDEFVEDFQEGLMSRRDALKRIAAITGSLTFATAILAACGSPEPAASTATSPPAAAEATTAPAEAATEAATTAPTEAATEAATSAATAETATSAPATAAATADAGTTATASGAATTQTAGAAATSPASVPEGDPDVTASMVEFPGEGATLMGYLARPSGEGSFPIILVCHENRGLTPHIQDVTRRVAKAGYVGLAVDLLSRQGGTAALPSADAVPEALGQLPEGQPVQDFQSGLRYAQEQPFVDRDRVGMTGFCYGGGITWRVATKTPELRAAVPYYGPPPPVAEVPGIQAAVLAIYGGLDERINASIPEIEAAMQQNGKTFQKQIYEGANHAFHNDTGPRYVAEAATDAWTRTIAWFDQYVKG